MPTTVLSRFVYSSRSPRSPMRLRRLGQLGRYRNAIIFWITTIALGLITARVVGRASEPYPQSWGQLQRVAIVTKSIRAGDIVKRSDLAVRSIPAAFVPAHHSGTMESVVGRRTNTAMPTNSPVDLSLMTPGSSSALSELIGQHRRGFALPSDTAPNGLTIGDRVEVFVNRDGDGVLAATIADAKVVQLADRQVLLSLTENDSKQLASAMSNGRPTIVLVGG